MWRKIFVVAGASVGTLALLLILLITAPTFARPVVAPVRGWLVKAATQSVSKGLNGTLEVGALEGSLFSAPSLLNVVVRDPTGAVAARIDAIHLRYALASLLSGQLVIHDIDVIRPDLTLSQAPDGTLNLARLLLTAPQPADFAETRRSSSTVPIAVQLKRLRVQGGRSRLALGFLKGVTEITGLQMTLSGHADGTGVHLTIQELAAQAHPAQVNLTKVRGSLHMAGRQLRIEQFQVHTENTHADVNVTVPGSTHPVQLSGRLHPIDMTEIGRLLADDTLRGNLQLEVQAQGPLNDLRLHADLRADAGQVTFQGRVNATDSPQRYRGTLEVRKLDMAVLANREALQSDLNMVLDINGRGLSPETLDGELNVSIEPSHLGDITLSRSQIRIVAQSQRIHVEAFELISSVTTVTAGGSLDFAGTSDLTYEARAHLPQLGPLLGVESLDGSLHLQGSAAGAWPDLEAAGKLMATGMRFDTHRLQHLELDFHATRVGAAPQASAQMRLHDLAMDDLPITAAQLEAAYDGVRRQVTFTANLTQSPQMESNLAGRITLGDGVQRAVLDTVQFRFEDRIWHAPEPLELTAQSGAFDIKSFRLVHGEESISLTGGFGNDSIRNVRLEASSIDLTYLQTRLDLPGPAAGRVSLDVQAAGTFTEPQLQAGLRVIPSAGHALPFDHLQATVRYERKRLSGHISARHDHRDVIRVHLEAPLDLALANLPLSERLLDAPLSLSAQILQPSLASLQNILPTPGLSGTLQGDVTLRGTFAQLKATSDIQLQNLGVQNAIDSLHAPIRMTAELETAGSVSALGQALTSGTFNPRLLGLDLRIDMASGKLPESVHDQTAQPITVKNVRLQASGAWGPDGFQATIANFQVATDAFNLPSTTLSASAHITPSQFDLQRLEILTPQSRLEGQGGMTLADRRFNLQLEVPRLHLTEFAPSLPPLLAREVTGTLQLGGSTTEPTLMAQMRYGGAHIHLQGAADLQQPAYSATVTLDELDVAPFLPAADGTFHAQITLNGKGFSDADRRADLHLTLNSDDFNLAPKFSGVAQAALLGSAITLDTLHFDSVPAQLTAAGKLSQTRQLEADYRIIFKDLTPLGLHLGTPVRANGVLSGSISGPFDGLQAQGEMQLEEWGYGNFQGERVRVAFQGEGLTTDPRATLNASFDGIEGNALAASSVTLDGRYRDRQAQVDFSVTDGPYQKTRIAGQVALRDSQDINLSTLQLRYRHWSWTNPGPVRIVRRADGTVLFEGFHLQYGEQAIRADGSLHPSGPIAASLSLHEVEIEPWLRTFVPAVAASGRVNLALTAEGSVTHPEATGVLQLDDLTWNSKPLGQIRIDLSLEDDTSENHLQWHDGNAALLEAKGTVGLRNDYPLDLKVTSSSFDLARLAPLFDTVEKSSGSLDLQLHVGGTVRTPDIRGNIALRDGTLLLPVTGAPYQDIQARLTLGHNRLDIDTFSLASRTGTLSLDGWLEADGRDLKHLQLSLQAQDFTAMNTPSVQARLTGAVRAQGSLDALAIKGDLTIPRARIRFEKFGADPASVSPSDLTVAGVYGGDPEKETDASDGEEAESESLAKRILQTELNVSMPRNVWVVGPGTALEIQGSLRVAKNFNGPFVIGGSTQTVRGFVGFMGKKFELERGKVTFTGANDVNPFLDVVARYQISDYTVLMHVEGDSKRPQLNLSSTPDLAEEDILSLLVFGKTTDRLSGSEASSLSSQAGQVAGSVISKLLEKQVGKTLGLDTLEVELGDGLETGSSVKGGRYITQDLFLSYERQLDRQGGNTVEIEYSLGPRMKLKGTSSDQGQSSLDLLWRIDY